MFYQSCIIVSILLVTYYKNAAAESPASTPPTEEALARFGQGSIDFTNKILTETISNYPDENVVASGTSVLIPLALLSLYSKDVVQEQLFKLLNLNNNDEIEAVFSELLKEFNSQTDVTLKIANEIYVNKDYPLSDPFKNDAKGYFSVEAENLDFSEKEEAAEHINDIVSNGTDGNIEDIISPSAFDVDTQLVMVNGIYFLGNWIHQFNEEDTKTKDFTNSKGEIVDVEMMYQQNNFKYAENDLFQALQLPYKGNSFSFLVILPILDEDLMQALDYFKDPTKFSDLLDSMTCKTVQVYLPKFQINLNIDPILYPNILRQDVGVTAIFDPDNDGFDGILQESEPISVSGIFQEAFVVVNEYGTEDAAATATMDGTTCADSSEESYVYDASRPFAFYILVDNRVPLFCGAFVG